MIYDCTSLECNNYDVAIGYDECDYGDSHHDSFLAFCWEIDARFNVLP